MHDLYILDLGLVYFGKDLHALSYLRTCCYLAHLFPFRLLGENHYFTVLLPIFVCTCSYVSHEESGEVRYEDF